MDPFDRVFSPTVVFKDGGGEGGGEGGGQGGGSGSGGGGAGGGSGSGGEGGSGDGRRKTGNEDHQKHFNDGFNLGFGKGAEKKEKEAQDKVNAIYKSLGLDPDQENLEDQVKALKAVIKKANEGGEGGKGKKDDALVEQLRGELQKANKAIEETKSTHETEIRKILIDQHLLNLAGAAGLAKGVSPQAAATLFKGEYVLDLDKDRKVTVTQPNGAPIVDPKNGETKTLEGVFKDWIGQNSYLLAASNRGGSGGAGPGDGGAGGGSGGGQGADGVQYLTVEEAEKLPMDQYEKLTLEGKLKIKPAE